MDKKPTLFTSLSPALLHLFNLQNAVVVKCKRLCNEILGSITAGEREGKVIEGLQYGNSPTEYPREFIEDKTLVLTTTNGTKLLHMAFAKGCANVVTGSFANLSAVCDYVIAQDKNVILGCSGWKERFNLEDTLLAGAVIDRVKEHFIIHDDSSLMASEMFIRHRNDLYSFIQHTTHWHRLAAYGLQKDLEYCVSTDVANILPVLKNGELIIT